LLSATHTLRLQCSYAARGTRCPRPVPESTGTVESPPRLGCPRVRQGRQPVFTLLKARAPHQMVHGCGILSSAPTTVLVSRFGAERAEIACWIARS
jgi:hypothetical protein